jgi:hypothetical protein
MIHFRGTQITSLSGFSVLHRDERLGILGQVRCELENTRSEIQSKTLQMLVDGRRVRYIKSGQNIVLSAG